VWETGNGSAGIYGEAPLLSPLCAIINYLSAAKKMLFFRTCSMENGLHWRYYILNSICMYFLFLQFVCLYQISADAPNFQTKKASKDF